MPFPPHYETQVLQGYHGYITHKEDLAYSVDLRCAIGDPIAASRSGRVWAIKEDSAAGCADASCVDSANYVILDHGDGTFSEYYHLRRFGALVEVGEHVCAGDVIGLCGNTGYSTGPHLHFALTNPARQTLPVYFEEARPLGTLVPEAKYVSANRRQARCIDRGFSSLGRGAFAHQGIVLDEPLPLLVDHSTLNRPIRIRGKYTGDHPLVALHRRHLESGEWHDQCFEVDAEGRFEMSIDWPAPLKEPGMYWLMMTGADEACLSPGWGWAYKMRVYRPTIQDALSPTESTSEQVGSSEISEDRSVDLREQPRRLP